MVAHVPRCDFDAPLFRQHQRLFHPLRVIPISDTPLIPFDAGCRLQLTRANLMTVFGSPERRLPLHGMANLAVDRFLVGRISKRIDK